MGKFMTNKVTISNGVASVNTNTAKTANINNLDSNEQDLLEALLKKMNGNTTAFTANEETTTTTVKAETVKPAKRKRVKPIKNEMINGCLLLTDGEKRKITQRPYTMVIESLMAGVPRKNIVDDLVILGRSGKLRSCQSFVASVGCAFNQIINPQYRSEDKRQMYDNIRFCKGEIAVRPNNCKDENTFSYAKCVFSVYTAIVAKREASYRARAEKA